MDDFISRKAAIQSTSVWNGDVGTEAWIRDALEKLPAADVRPVVKAHWIKCNRGAGYKCSVCKARSSWADVLHGNHKFCYKCGAMMEES